MSPIGYLWIALVISGDISLKVGIMNLRVKYVYTMVNIKKVEDVSDIWFISSYSFTSFLR